MTVQLLDDLGPSQQETEMKSRGALIIGPLVSVASAVVTAMSGASVVAVLAVFLLAGPVASVLFALFNNFRIFQDGTGVMRFLRVVRRSAPPSE